MGSFHSSFFNIPDLEFANTDIGRAELIVARGIWKMPQLRYIKCSWILLHDPPRVAKKVTVILGNLQTLTNVVNFWLNEEVYKKLRLEFDSSEGD